MKKLIILFCLLFAACVYADGIGGDGVGGDGIGGEGVETSGTVATGDALMLETPDDYLKTEADNFLLLE